jgi:hypothetical protein
MKVVDNTRVFNACDTKTDKDNTGAREIFQTYADCLFTLFITK